VIVFCQGFYGERFEQTKKCVERVRHYVDRVVLIASGDVTEEHKAWLKERGCEIYTHKWEDSMVKMRNQYLQKCQTYDWVCVSDPDELYGEELCKDLRKIIAKAEEEGYGLLLVPSHDVTTWEDGRTETHVSGFAKNLIFKKNPGVKYRGVGNIPEVHENLVLAPNTKVMRLPEKYFYEHIKYEHEIWERAARNVYLAGGGDNVGELNPAWKPLRQICAGLGLENWPQVRAYLRKGNIDSRLKEWIIAHRFEGTNYEHEMLEFFKWYKWLHPEELKGIEPVENLKESTPDVIREYIGRLYSETLGVPLNEQDKMQLATSILAGEIQQKDLPNLFRRYQREVVQRSTPPALQRGEKVRLPVPVDVDVHITDEIFERALLESETYWKKIKPRIDLGQFLEEQVWDKGKFHRWFYENKNEVTLDALYEYVKTHGINTVALCIMGYSDVMLDIISTVKRYGKYFDEIHVQSDSFLEYDLGILKGLGAQTHVEPWKEDFSDYKNKVIAHANTHWVLVCDHDEIPTPELVEHLREIIENSERGEKYNIVRFNCIDVTVDKKGNVIREQPMGPRKELLHVNVKEPYYGNPHVWLKPDYYPWRSVTVPYAYKHFKEEGIEVIRAVRNVFLGGGGDNWRERNELWVELRAITDELKIFSWKDFHAYLKKGNIDSRLKDLFERMYKKPWHDDELRAFKEYYYKLHPEEVEK